jgi:hypothetical protein
MKSCAYCGRENQDDARHCRECGKTEFEGDAAPMMESVPAPVEPVAELPDPESDVSPDDEAVLCTFCLFPNLPEAMWCKRCGASISIGSIMGPAEAARGTGSVWRGAVKGRPKPGVLIGVWLLFLPTLLFGLLVIANFLANGIKGPFDLVMCALSGAYAAIAFMMLYQVTRNYINTPAAHLNEPDRTTQ